MTPNKPQLTCLSIDCPERKSLCCGAISKNDRGRFVCSKCGEPYIGGECDAQTMNQHKETPNKAGEKEISMFVDGQWIPWDGRDVQLLMVKETMTLEEVKKHFPEYETKN